MIRMAVRVLAVLVIVCPAALPDLTLAPGTKIIFGDNSELDSAPGPGGTVPAGHGGTANTVSGTSAYVGGGSTNTASGIYSTVSAGRLNTAQGAYAAVGGGVSNSAGGFAATIPGGSNNVASASYTFAAGRRAKSTAQGAMTFADSTNTDFTNNSENSFRVRANGGVYLITKTDLTEYFAINGFGNAALTGNLVVGGTVSSSSDRDLKENFQTVDERTVLEKMASLPLARYNFRDDDPAVTHMGVMAQDFHDAFGLGGDPKYISTTDADGVAFASIQALYDMLLERDQRIETLESALADVSSRLETLEGHAGR